MDERVCQNYVDDYRSDWHYLCHESYVKHLYEAGTAFYNFPNCPLIDMVAPIHFNSGSTEALRPCDLNVEMPVARSYTYYCPLLISIMSCYNCGPQDAENISERALEQLKEAKCMRALFLVIIMGLTTKLDYKDLSLKGKDDIDLLAKGECIAQILSMPKDKCFGLSKSLISLILIH